MAVPKQARESSPTLKMLHQEARSISDDFSKRAAREGLAQWTPADIALGLAADVGDLAKLVQKRSGLRPGTATDAALSDEPSSGQSIQPVAGSYPAWEICQPAL